jgi:hypothetical protein
MYDFWLYKIGYKIIFYKYTNPSLPIHSVYFETVGIALQDEIT